MQCPNSNLMNYASNERGCLKSHVFICKYIRKFSIGFLDVGRKITLILKDYLLFECYAILFMAFHLNSNHQVQWILISRISVYF